MTIKVVGRDIVTLQIFCYCVFYSSELMDFPAIKSSSEGPGVVANEKAKGTEGLFAAEVGQRPEDGLNRYHF